MFSLAVLKDIVRVAPHSFGIDITQAITNAINCKFANKVFICVRLFPALHVNPVAPNAA
jgi:DNA-directed RNA polymerase III subunit RPC8